MVKLKTGDIFCSKNPMALGRAILAVERFWSSDNQAEYSHSGIIINSNGTTMESLWKVRKQNLYQAYNDEKVLIGRYKKMGLENFYHGYSAVYDHYGQIYPFWRLAFCLIPPVSKYVNFGRLVCSEFTGKFLYKSGFKKFKQYLGLTPDHIADRIKNWDEFEIIYEGVLK